MKNHRDFYHWSQTSADIGMHIHVLWSFVVRKANTIKRKFLFSSNSLSFESWGETGDWLRILVLLFSSPLSLPLCVSLPVARATHSFDFLSVGSFSFHDWRNFFFNIASFQEVEGRLKQQQQEEHYIHIRDYTGTWWLRECRGNENESFVDRISRTLSLKIPSTMNHSHLTRTIILIIINNYLNGSWPTDERTTDWSVVSVKDQPMDIISMPLPANHAKHSFDGMPWNQK